MGKSRTGTDHEYEEGIEFTKSPHTNYLSLSRWTQKPEGVFNRSQ